MLTVFTQGSWVLSLPSSMTPRGVGRWTDTNQFLHFHFHHYRILPSYPSSSTTSSSSLPCSSRINDSFHPVLILNLLHLGHRHPSPPIQSHRFYHFPISLGYFPTEYEPTVFENYVETLTLDGQLVELSLWDTAGESEFQSVGGW